MALENTHFDENSMLFLANPFWEKKIFNKVFSCPPCSFKVDQSDEIKILKGPKLTENTK